MARPVVFISYSHDSEEHQEKVLGLSERLRQDGLDARLDQYVKGTPEQGWPRWMLNQLDEADFVLVVCTETYYRRFRGHERPNQGKGADWEGVMITQEIYDSKSQTVKFVPVMLTAGQGCFIPEPLRPHTHYELRSEERYRELYSFLCGQAGVEPTRLGDMKPIVKRSTQPLTFGSSGPTMFGVPHKNFFFTGRIELLSRLHQQLQTQGLSALAQAAIYGLGGVGKTQIAIEYAHQFGKYYRFILWIPAEDEVTIDTTYLSIAHKIGIIEPQFDLRTAADSLKGWLATEESWLLIFDNADDPSLIRGYLPSTRTGGKVLLTSRSKAFTSIGISEPIRVDTLEPDDAVKFLTKRAKAVDETFAAELAFELGYLPLALEQAAAYIETIGCSFAEYLAKYRREGIRLLKRGKPSTDYSKTIATTWTLNFDAVQKASPASAVLLITAAFLDPDSIPIEIFTLGYSGFRNLPATITTIRRFCRYILNHFYVESFRDAYTLAETLKDARADSLVFWELLEPLERYSLVERLPEGAFKMHRLTQEVIKERLGESGIRAWADRILQVLAMAYPFSLNWNLCHKLQTTPRSAYALASKYNLESVGTAFFFNNAGYFAWQQGNYNEAKRLLELSLRMRTRLLGDDDPGTLKSQSNLATTLVQLGDLSTGKILHEQTLRFRRYTLGPDHPDTLESLNNLAEALRISGELASAHELQVENLTIRERLMGKEHPMTLTAMSNLALILAALGDLPGARKIFEEVLDLRERALGYEHPDTTNTTWNLCLTLFQLNDSEAAIRLIHKLRWLVDRSEASIPTARQREVRRWLLDIFNSSQIK